MRRRLITTAAVLGMTCTGHAAAAPIYFHKPGVVRATFVADITACEDLAGMVRTPAQPSAYTPDLYAVAAASFFSSFFGSRERRGVIDNVMRTCMADKGYRRVEPSADARKTLAHLSRDDRIVRLFALAAAPEPAGKVLPR